MASKNLHFFDDVFGAIAENVMMARHSRSAFSCRFRVEIGHHVCRFCLVVGHNYFCTEVDNVSVLFV